MTNSTDLIAELAEVVAQIYSAASKDDDGLTIDAGLFASDFLRTHHATLTRIIESEATIRADYDALVIRLGEVTTRLEAEMKDADRYRWLRDDAIHYARDDDQTTPWVVFGTCAADVTPHWEQDLDAAIDAAMHNSAREG